MPTFTPAVTVKHDDLNPEISSRLRGKRAAVILYSPYLIDPRPRRAAEAMIEAGMEVDVLCISAVGENEPAHEIAHGVRISRLSLTQQRKNKLAYLWQYGRFFAASFWFLTWGGLRRKYDVVHVHNMPDVLVFSALIAKFRGARIILDLHDPMPELMMNIYDLSADRWPVRLLCLLERWSIGLSNVVFTPNITFKTLFVSRSCRPEKMHIIMNSPLPEVFNPDLAPESPRGRTFRIMHHGTILHRHGIDILVEAVHRLRSKIPGIKLDIYGLHTPITDQILAQVRQLELTEVVTYHGSKSQAEIAQAIRETDLGIVPNRRSVFTELNFPTRIFEYLAMRRPAIVPATRGIMDYFKPDEILMFEPGDVEDLAAKILWVWENPVAAADILERGIQVYRANLWTDQKKRFLECVAGPAKP